MTVTRVEGVDLTAGHLLAQHLPGGGWDVHRIHHLREYPGRFLGFGDHARIAYDRADERTAMWRCTIGDRETFYITDTESKTT